MSIQQLLQHIEPRMLTIELGGTLQYDHAEWIELRICFEQFISDVVDSMDKLHRVEVVLNSNCYAESVEQAKVSFLNLFYWLYTGSKIFYF